MSIGEFSGATDSVSAADLAGQIDAANQTSAVDDNPGVQRDRGGRPIDTGDISAFSPTSKVSGNRYRLPPPPYPATATAPDFDDDTSPEDVMLKDDCVAATFAHEWKAKDPAGYASFAAGVLATGSATVKGNEFSIDDGTAAEIQTLPPGKQADAAATAAIMAFAQDASGSGGVDLNGVAALDRVLPVQVKFGQQPGDFALVHADGELHITKIVQTDGDHHLELKDAFGQTMSISREELADANEALGGVIGSSGTKATTLSSTVRHR